MSEGALWLIYASAAVPAYFIRRRLGWRVFVLALVGGCWSLSIWLMAAWRSGLDLSDKWSAVGVWVSFWFGAVAGVAGAGAAILRE